MTRGCIRRFPAMNRRGERARGRSRCEEKKKGKGSSSRLSHECSGRNIHELTAATIPRDKLQKGRISGGSRSTALKSPPLLEPVLKGLDDAVEFFGLDQGVTAAAGSGYRHIIGR